jgi:hypothetical protein
LPAVVVAKQIEVFESAVEGRVELMFATSSVLVRRRDEEVIFRDNVR